MFAFIALGLGIVLGILYGILIAAGTLSGFSTSP